MSNIKKPIRMCVCCRLRFNKYYLLRLQCIDKSIVSFTNSGRSFYLCEACYNDTKRVKNSIYKQCKNKADYEIQLKEIVRIWKTK